MFICSYVCCEQDLAEFGSKVRKLEQNLDESPVFSFEYSMSEAWESLDHFSKQLSVLENEAQDLAELQDLLEANVVNFEILPKLVSLSEKMIYYKN